MTIRELITPYFRRARRARKGGPDSFLGRVTGIVHVGANTGQERELYASLGLRVIWVEPIPQVFAELSANIQGLRGQRALQALVTDVDGKEYEFHVASNSGLSSSILDFKEHGDIWPDVHYASTIRLRSLTLASLLERERVNPRKYQALVMDTQGSELLVLRGSLPILRHFRFIKTEVPDFEAYAGCCQLSDIGEFMAGNGYEEISRNEFARRDGGGSYFDVVYRRTG